MLKDNIFETAKKIMRDKEKEDKKGADKAPFAFQDNLEMIITRNNSGEVNEHTQRA